MLRKLSDGVDQLRDRGSGLGGKLFGFECGQDIGDRIGKLPDHFFCEISIHTAHEKRNGPIIEKKLCDRLPPRFKAAPTSDCAQSRHGLQGLDANLF